MSYIIQYSHNEEWIGYGEGTPTEYQELDTAKEVFDRVALNRGVTKARLINKDINWVVMTFKRGKYVLNH